MKGGSDHNNTENGITHGAAVLMEIVLPWENTHRIVCADIYFALVTATELLYINGLKFIGNVKKATRKYLLAHLASQELEKGGTGMGWLRGIPAHMGVTYWHMYGSISWIFYRTRIFHG